MAHRLEFYFVNGCPLDHGVPWKVFDLNTDELDEYIEDMGEDELCAIFVNDVLVKIIGAFEYEVDGVIANIVYNGNANRVELKWERTYP